MNEHYDPGFEKRQKDSKKALEDLQAFVIETATDPLTYLGGGSTVAAKGAAKLLPKVARGLFAGTLAGQTEEAEAALHALKAAPEAMKNAASKLMKSGASRQEVFQKTGLFQNPRGEWRYYTPDSQSTVDLNVIRSLDPRNSKTSVWQTADGRRMMSDSAGKQIGDIFKNPTLFSMKPDLAKQPVKVLPENASGSAAYGYSKSDPSNGMLYLKQGQLNNMPEAFNQYDYMRQLQHEVGGHGVQTMDQLPNGATMEQFLTPADLQIKEQSLKIRNIAENIANQAAFAAGVKTQFSIDDLYRANRYAKLANSGKKVTDAEKAAFEKFAKLPNEAQSQLRPLVQQYEEVARDLFQRQQAAGTKYKSVPGEVEANFTAKYWDRDLTREGVDPSLLYDDTLIPDRNFYMNFK
jgi:hypothetical protein